MQLELKLIQAAKLAGFDCRKGWPETFTPDALAALQAGRAQSESRDWRDALHLAIQTGGIGFTAESKEKNPQRRFVQTAAPVPVSNTGIRVRVGYWETAEPKQRTVHHITARAFAEWLAVQGEHPSALIAAWFKAQGVAAAAQAAPVPAPASQAVPEPVPPAAQVEPELPDPQRRLKRLRDMGGRVTRNRGVVGFKGIVALTRAEKAEGRPRSDEKTIREDIKIAVQAEDEEKRRAAIEKQQDQLTGSRASPANRK